MRENPHLLLRGLAVWGVIILVESLHGTVRELWLRPLLGDFHARQISVFTAMTLILMVSLIFARWLRATQKRQLLAVGAFWALLTVAFEFGLGRFVLKYSWTRLLEDYNLARGGLMGLGLLFLFFAPWLAAKLRGLAAR